MGQKWTIETKADFTLSKKYSEDTKLIITIKEKETKIYLTIIKPSLDENDIKENVFFSFINIVLNRVLKSKFGKYVLINKYGEKSTEGGKIDWENVLDGDLLYCIAEKYEEIQTALAEVYKEVMDFVETM